MTQLGFGSHVGVQRRTRRLVGDHAHLGVVVVDELHTLVIRLVDAEGVLVVDTLTAVPSRTESELDLDLARVADEIAERQRFIDSMRALGKAGQHELRIKNEIADRMSDLARVERLQRAADEQAGASPPRPVGGPAVVTHGA